MENNKRTFAEVQSLSERHKRRLVKAEVRSQICDIETELEQITRSPRPALVTVQATPALSDVNIVADETVLDSSSREDVQLFEEHSDDLALEYFTSDDEDGFECTLTSQESSEDEEESLSPKVSVYRERLGSSVLLEKLKSWALSTGIRGNNLTSLLKTLRECGIDNIPSDGRTLLSIRRNIAFDSFSEGKFYYFGCENQLNFCLRNVKLSEVPCKVQVRFNIDGIPLFKSDNTQLWCILGACDFESTPVFPVAIFCGKKSQH